MGTDSLLGYDIIVGSPENGESYGVMFADGGDGKSFVGGHDSFIFVGARVRGGECDPISQEWGNLFTYQALWIAKAVMYRINDPVFDGAVGEVQDAVCRVLCGLVGP